MKSIRPLINSIVFAVLVWCGYVEGLSGARNIVQFLVGVLAVLAALLFVGMAIDKDSICSEAALRERKPRWVMRWSHTLDLLCAAVMVWYGAVFTAAGLLLFLLLACTLAHESEKKRAALGAKGAA